MEETSTPPPAGRVARVIASAERGAVVAIIAVMAGLPALETIGRRLLGEGIPDSARYVQHLTLWIGFLGALLATRSGKHLSLATGELIPAGPFRRAARTLVAAISAGTTAVLAYAAWELVKVDTERTARLAGGIPEWWSETIMPVALGLMALRFAWRASDGWLGRVVAAAAIAGCLSLGRYAESADRLVLPGAVVLGVGVLLGTPVFVAMSGMAMLLFFAEGSGVAAVPTETYRLVASPTLPAIPLFTAAGYILAEGGASERLMRLARALVGWLPGGMALVVVFVCAAFTALTGGSGVTILALGGLVLPILRTAGYPEDFSLGLVTSAGSLGLLLPPSIPVILYAVYAKASHEELYIAGFVPSILLVLLVAAYSIVMGVRYRAPRTPFRLKEAILAIWGAKIEMAIPLLVLASIRFGLATMVESAAIAVVLAVVSETILHRDLHPTRDLPCVVEHAATLVGAVVILLGVAMGLTSYLVDAEIPAAVLAWTEQHIHSQHVFLLALNGALLVLGSVLEIYSAIVILAPLLPPLAEAYHVGLLHMGIIFLVNLELGFLFPPMGLNLILASTRFNRPLGRLYRVALPFLLIMGAGVLLVTYVPAMTSGVLDWMRK
jgi:C4-dicarboxylate transporter DctM subunit